MKSLVCPRIWQNICCELREWLNLFKIIGQRDRVDFPELVQACYEIEKQIQENLNVPVSEISDEAIKIDESFLETEI